MNKENIVYVKIKNEIFKCYKSEQMHKPIYYPVESKTNGYIDYNDVEKILTIEDLYQEIQELKKQLENTINSYTEEHNLRHNSDLKLDLLKTQQKEFIKYLEDEKDRLARECSQIYEDSLGKTRLVNEDIFNEVNDVLQKYKSIIGVLDDKTN